jgi:TolB protein
LWSPTAPSDGGGPPPAGWSKQATTLYLVDPLGGRYQVAVLPPPAEYGLLDWSGDGRRALIEAPARGARSPSEIEDLSLATGQVLHRFVPPSAVASYRYSRPRGLAVLGWGEFDGPGSSVPLVRLSLSGARELTYPTSYPGVGPFRPFLSAGVLPSLDGTELVVQADEGMALLANDGSFIREIGPRGQQCGPDRWWGPDELVASCSATSAYVPALWLVPTSGAPASQLTHPTPPDLGDMDGWQVGGHVYTQAAGACGTEFLAARRPDGGTKPVPVPHAGLDVIVVGAEGARLALQAKLGCGSAKSLFWFDPATGAEAPLLGPPLNVGTVLAALPYPGLED